MTVKNILVAYSGTDSAKSALKLAKRMMLKYDAELTGALTHGPSDISVTLRPYATAELAKIIADAEQQRCNAICDSFYAALDLPGNDRVHWIDAGGEVDFSLAKLARTYDIVVMGQYDGDRENRNMVPHPDVVALNSGRPIMIVPKDLDPSVLNDKVLLAWDGGRSAARALSDALSILQTKSEITVLNVGEDNPQTAETLRGVSRQLDRHGIKCDIDITPRNHNSVATVLLEKVNNLGAGLLVMGAYQHSKFAEDIWGGVTKTILKNAKVPVLMSH